jgi:hypothetical protein
VSGKYREWIPIAVAVPPALLLTVPIGWPVFMLTGQSIGKTDADLIIPRCALGVFAILFVIVYAVAVAHLRRQHRLPVLHFSLRRLLVCVALVALNIYPNAIARTQHWTPHPSQVGDVANGLRVYGWPLNFQETTLLVSGSEVPVFHVYALIFNVLFVALLAFFVLALRVRSEVYRD